MYSSSASYLQIDDCLLSRKSFSYYNSSVQNQIMQYSPKDWSSNLAMEREKFFGIVMLANCSSYKQ